MTKAVSLYFHTEWPSAWVRAGLSRIAIKIAPTGEATMRRAMTMPMKKQIARNRKVDQPGCTCQWTNPRSKVGAGTPGSPFSPPV